MQSTSAQSKPVDSSAGLQDAAQRLLNLIESGSPMDLLNFWSESGVTLGVDFEDHPISKSAAREQLKEKSGLYCSFFDSECLTNLVNESRRKAHRATPATRAYSFRDILSNARSKTVRASVRREGDTLAGYVTVRIENGETTKFNTKTELTFTFVSEAGQWKLAEIPKY